MTVDQVLKKILEYVKGIITLSKENGEVNNENLTNITELTEQTNNLLITNNGLLNSLLAESKIDFEMASVRDSNGDIYQLVFEKDETTGAVITSYIDADGNIAVPVGAVEFLDPLSLLSTIITEIQKLTAAKAPTSVASTGITNIPTGATEISVFNNGTGNATVNGTTCPPGVTRTFGFKNPTSAIIVCDGGGTEQLIIDYMA